MPAFSLFWRGSLGAIVGGLFLLGCAESDPRAETGAEGAGGGHAPPDAPAFDIQSVTLDARRRPDSTVLRRLDALGVTHVTLVSFGWQRAADEPRIRVDTSDGWYTESHSGIRALARQASALGMDVILKPHIWAGRHDEGTGRSDIGFDTKAEWNRWEADYRRFLMTYARLAAEIDADILVLGTELTRVATERPAFWRDLARHVRTVYDGALTYAANWHKEYRDVEFWDVLDYVGVQAYFPLSEDDSSSLGALRRRWRVHREELAEVHRQTGKPILFTEIGYRSARSAARAPWEWPEEDGEDMPADSALQARCYRAFLSVMDRVPWFAGGIVWKWHSEGRDRRPTAFTPQGKPAERVLQRWFTGASADSGQAVSARSATRARR